MSCMLGHNRLLRRLNRDNGAVTRLYGQDRFLMMTNILRCDIHRETALTVLAHHFDRNNGGAQSVKLRPRRAGAFALDQ